MIVSEADAMTPGHCAAVDLGAVFSRVLEALERQWVKEHGPIEEGDVTRDWLERQCGYLVGVQVGLRLRGVL